MPTENFWDQRYGQDHFVYGTEPNDFLKEQASRFAPGAEVLCLADGEGRNGVFLATQGLRITSVDGSPVGLEKANRLAAERGVTLATVASDLAHYDLGEARWDGIVSIWCHLPPLLRADVHKRAVGALRPGGVFLLEAYSPAQLAYRTGGPPDVAMLMTLDGLRRELQGLEILLGEEKLREVHEGPGHTGLGAVVQVVAQKPR